MPKGLIYNGGDDSREDPPVPIPNTEVKLSYADGTASCGRVGSCRLSLLLSSVGSGTVQLHAVMPKRRTASASLAGTNNKRR